MVLKTAIPIPHAITDKDLPETDGSIVENFAELPQVILLTSAIRPVLDRLHPDGLYLIGGDSGIYWELTDPPLDGCKSPDWFYVPGVSQSRPEDGEYRRSYVLFNERVPPRLIIEIVSKDGEEERDTTPGTGKFWVYENGIRAECYAIFDPLSADRRLQVFERLRGRFREMKPNDQGLYELPEMGVALGTWYGKYANHEMHWVRFYDLDGRLLPSDVEAVELERERADEATEEAKAERRRARAEKQRADKAAADMAELLAKLQAKGIDPNTL